MVAFSYQSIDYAGTDTVFTAPTGGLAADGINPTDSRGFFWVKNAAAGGTISVTISTPGSSFGQALPDVVVSIPDGEERMIGPMVAALGDPAANGGIIISITPNVTGVTAAALTLP